MSTNTLSATKTHIEQDQADNHENSATNFIDYSTSPCTTWSGPMARPSSSPNRDKCQVWSFDVGILRPNWMVKGANYLGQRYKDGFLCDVWEKANEFIHYYEDVVSKLPVYWLLFTGKETHVMTFEVGAVLEDTKWQAPSYCFKTDAQQTATSTSPLSQAGRVRHPTKLM